MPPYVYSRIDTMSHEFRLFDLLPGQPGDQLEFNIYKVPFTGENKDPPRSKITQARRNSHPVLQDNQLADPNSLIICRHLKLPRRIFRRDIIMLREKLSGPPSELRKRLDSVSELCWNRSADYFPSLLHFASQYESALPEDKICGVLGLAPPLISRAVRAQYLLALGDAYSVVFLQHTKLTRRLELLPCREHCHLDGTPSAPHVLEITGTRFAVASFVHEISQDEEASMFDVIRRIGEAKLHSTPYVSGGSLLNAFASVFTDGEYEAAFGALMFNNLKENIASAAGSGEQPSQKPPGQVVKTMPLSM
ncbi:hypothetical protein BJ878DRAFT_539305 [Calycina marina]|uniref:Uncharacterized protein n=1 Tax=Calycina marina TaxID=1763456 RepID=A0A9P8CI38_9HELO|nr:hypothetical protein BJ878DRAFT_539305 [Calycina marina]